MSAPGWIMIMLEPISLICAWMLCFDPWPMANIVITEATPMMMPSMVRNPRSLLLANARIAIFSKFAAFILICF